MADERIYYSMTFEEVKVCPDGREAVRRKVYETVKCDPSDEPTELIGGLTALLVNAICNADEPWTQGVLASMIRRLRDIDAPFRELARIHEETSWADKCLDFSQAVKVTQRKKKGDA